MRSDRKAVRMVCAVLSASLSIALMSIIAGCGGGGSNPAKGADGSGAGGQITFLTAEEKGVFDPVVAAFERQNPSIKVKVQYVPFDALNSTIQARLGSKDSGIDVYHVDEPRVPALAARGFLADLSGRRDAVAGKVSGNAIEAVSWNGKMWAFPQWTSAQLLYYNTEILKKAGVKAPPAAPKQALTWEQFMADAKKVIDSKASRWGVAINQVDRYYQLQPLPESAGGGSGLSGPDMLQPDVSNPGWVKAMTWYSDLFKDGITPRGVNADQTLDLFLRGQAAFFLGGTWNIAPIAESKSVKFGIAPHPYFQGGKQVTPTDSWAVGVSPLSKHPAAAKKLAEFISVNKTGAELAIERSLNIPVQKDAFGGYVSRAAAQGGSVTASLGDIIQYDIANTAVSRPRSVGYLDFESVMNKTFSDIANGAPVPARLKQASSELNSRLERYR